MNQLKSITANVPLGAGQTQLKEKVNEFVNLAFYGTLLQEFRNAQEPTILDRGPGRQMFWQMLDQELLQQMSKKDDSPLADALLRQLNKQQNALTAQLQSQMTSISGRQDG